MIARAFRHWKRNSGKLVVHKAGSDRPEGLMSLIGRPPRKTACLSQRTTRLPQRTTHLPQRTVRLRRKTGKSKTAFKQTVSLMRENRQAGETLRQNDELLLSTTFTEYIRHCHESLSKPLRVASLSACMKGALQAPTHKSCPEAAEALDRVRGRAGKDSPLSLQVSRAKASF